MKSLARVTSFFLVFLAALFTPLVAAAASAEVAPHVAPAPLSVLVGLIFVGVALKVTTKKNGARSARVILEKKELSDQTDTAKKPPATDLPEDFPSREVLLKHEGKDFSTLDAVDQASDEDLLAVHGVGEAMLKRIRAYSDN